MIRIRDSIQGILYRNHWVDDVNFKDTPERVDKWMSQHFTTRELSISNCTKYFEKLFPTTNSQMLVQGPIRVHSLCPHHLLPTEYDIYIGILLSEKALGLSKYTRVCESLSQYPWIQEELTHQIGDILEKNLNCKGIMIIIEGIHYCMKMRGVEQQNAITTTSELRGKFLDPPANTDPRGEFLSLIANMKLANNNR